MMRSRALRLALLAVLTACAEPPPAIRATMSVGDAMRGDTAGFLRADAPRTFVFPDDHGPHPGYRIEWWYYTGNLDAIDGRRFGFQLTFFRSAQAPVAIERASAWAANDVYMAHFALTDAQRGRFHASERFARAAAGLAGAQAAPFRVWLENWSAESMAGDGSVERGAADARAILPLRLRAAADDVALDLVLETGTPFVLQGDRGLSAKGPGPGNASYYFSFTRMPAHGTVRTDDGEHRVTGAAWMDREWSTSALGDDVAGWDWFALQLDDGADLMVYRLRREDGTRDPFDAGVLVDADGALHRLAADDFALDILQWWRSPLDGARYPARWRLRVPQAAIDVEIVPVLADQELNLTVRYWEGAVDVRGTRAGRPLRGRGYLEMTGWAAPPPTR
jgi:predicted secreted hydrolase